MSELIKYSIQIILKTLWLYNYCNNNIFSKYNEADLNLHFIHKDFSEIDQSSDHVFKLDANLKNSLETIFDEDFSDVNIHTGPYAHKLAVTKGANAVTIGNDIYFKNGMYKPDMEQGLSLLSHELTHVVQLKNNAGTDFPEDITQLEYQASKIEEQMTVLKIHNINIPLLSNKPQVNTDQIDNSGFKYEIDEKPLNVKKNESIDDFLKKDNEPYIKYKSSKGKTYIFSQTEYKKVINKAITKLMDYIKEKKHTSTEQDYNYFLIKVMNFLKN